MVDRLKTRLPSLSLVIWLTVVWTLLWGEVTLPNMVSGVAMALLVTVLLPIPRVERRSHIRPLACIVLVARFLVDVMVSAFHVAIVALRRRPPQPAVIKVQLRSHSDMVLATTAGLTSLIPGTVVVEAHRFSGVLYLHVLDLSVDDPEAGIESVREHTLRQEERLMRAISTNAELADAGYRPGWRVGSGDL